VLLPCQKKIPTENMMFTPACLPVTVPKLNYLPHFDQTLYSMPEHSFFSLSQFSRWEDGIKMDLRDIGWSAMDWIRLA
jgi:hypothetical protein